MSVLVDNERMPWKASLPIIGILLACIIGVWVTSPHIIVPKGAEFINSIINNIGFKIFATIVFCFSILGAISWSIWGENERKH